MPYSADARTRKKLDSSATDFVFEGFQVRTLCWKLFFALVLEGELSP
jgi:hypothetical protein